MLLLKPVSLGEFLQRVGSLSDSNIWIALVVDSKDIQVAVDDLQDTIEIFTECETGIISGENGARELIDRVVDATQDYLLFWQLEMWQPEEWRAFDALRSRLDKGKKGGLLVLSLDTAKTMLANAPNFVSWLGANIYDFAKDVEILTQEEGEKRLVALREWAGKSDAEVIAMAENQILPTDPEYGEWLILLNRGELLERQK
ncbi:ABC transporter permease [Tumidithrix elongata RA019]|uniref:ABC transporter permease n=1 Tax=Tumidithrix elongata BACA0141 TaxID=2716417 RepID=A0AAW9PRD5_9CYAN|nr:ABC transporter permease [Tumidithrix elongata RA019]